MKINCKIQSTAHSQKQFFQKSKSAPSLKNLDANFIMKRKAAEQLQSSTPSSTFSFGFNIGGSTASEAVVNNNRSRETETPPCEFEPPTEGEYGVVTLESMFAGGVRVKKGDILFIGIYIYIYI